ncbi:MAG: cytochrome P450 [Dehalococcoidia bacterium]
MNPFAPEVKACPYPFYDKVRETESVQWSSEIEAWLVTSHEHALAVLTDNATYSSRNVTSGASELDAEFPSLINSDGARHKQLRGLVAKAFTPRTLDSLWEPRIRQTANDLLDLVEGKAVFDVIADLAPLPGRITAEIIGVEPERSEDLKRWSDEIVMMAGLQDEDSSNEDRDVELGPRGEGAFAQLSIYLEGILANRKAAPRDDLVTRLIAAEVDGVHLTDYEIIDFPVLLIVSGNDAVADLIATGVRALIMQPELIARLRGQPDLIGDLVEEALRWESPFQCFYRRATIPAELGGKEIKPGDALLVLYAAANRDPQQFASPAEFNIARGRRDHLAFGMGAHYCLGANLARLQARVAIASIIERFESLAEVEGFEQQWRNAPFFRELVEYPVTFKLRNPDRKLPPGA